MSTGNTGNLTSFFGGVPFTPATVEPQADYNLCPPGKYPFLVEAAEVGRTKAENGHYVKLTLSCLDGPYKGQKLFDYINIDNPNKSTVEIAISVLSALGRAIGIQAVTDTAQLVNQVIIAHVKVKDGQNVIRTYSAPGAVQLVAPRPAEPLPSAPVGQPAAAPQQAPVQQAPTSPAPQQSGQTVSAVNQKPPWER